MAHVVNRNTVQVLYSVHTPDYPISDWIHNPDLSALVGVPRRHWKVNGDLVEEMTQAEKDVADLNNPANKYEDSFMITEIWKFLHFHADTTWSINELNSGMQTSIYKDVSFIPDPAVPTEPAFAIVDDGSTFTKIAYWDYGRGVNGSWVATEKPYDFPFLTAGHAVKQHNSNGSGNVSWNYAMGTEFQALAPGKITAISFKMGNGAATNDHRWEILKSSATGSSAPALNTYSVVDTGVYTIADGNTWEEVTLGSSITIAADEWYIARAYLGAASGQSANVNTLRNAGELVEDYVRIHAGSYVADNTGFPGANPLPAPTNRVTSTLYGLVSLRFEAP